MTPTLEKAARAIIEADHVAVEAETEPTSPEWGEHLAIAVLQAIRPRDGQDLPLSEIMARKYIDRILG